MDYRSYRSPRSRTFSLYSLASGRSSRSSLSLSPVSPLPSPAPTQVERANDVWGSFVPSGSAKHTLKQLYPIPSSPPTYHESVRGGPLHTASDARPGPSMSRAIPSPPRMTDLPTISRTSSPSPSPSISSSPATSSSASSINLERKRTSPDLHPVLARLERGSKLCGQKMACATCHTPGRDFPKCGKCQKMWCSRECRLVGGKRHVC